MNEKSLTRKLSAYEWMWMNDIFITAKANTNIWNHRKMKNKKKKINCKRCKMFNVHTIWSDNFNCLYFRIWIELWNFNTWTVFETHKKTNHECFGFRLIWTIYLFILVLQKKSLIIPCVNLLTEGDKLNTWFCWIMWN